MCKVPVTFGGGRTIENGLASALQALTQTSGLKSPDSSHFILTSYFWGSYTFGTGHAYNHTKIRPKGKPTPEGNNLTERL